MRVSVTFTVAPVIASSDFRARSASPGSIRRDLPWLRLCAGPAGCTLRRADRQTLGDDLSREGSPVVVAGNGQDRAGVTLRQKAALHETEDVLRKLEQPHAVRDRGLRAAHALRDLSEGERELVHEHGVGARLLDRGEILARHILDQRKHERLAVVALPDEGGDGREPGCTGRAPAAFPGDELVAAALRRPDDDGLHDSLRADRFGEAADPVRVDVLSRLARVRADRAERDLQQLGRGGAASR